MEEEMKELNLMTEQGYWIPIEKFSFTLSADNIDKQMELPDADGYTFECTIPFDRAFYNTMFRKVCLTYEVNEYRLPRKRKKMLKKMIMQKTGASKVTFILLDRRWHP